MKKNIGWFIVLLTLYILAIVGLTVLLVFNLIECANDGILGWGLLSLAVGIGIAALLMIAKKKLQKNED